MGSVDMPELPTYLLTPSLAGVLSIILTFVLPLVAALFMRRSWSAGSKGLVLLAVSAVKTFLEAWLAAVNTHVGFNFAGAAYATLVTFGVAVVGYFGLLRDTSVQRAAITSGPVRDPAVPPSRLV
ncbi:hypothetical protein ABZ671_00945 [Micromonospora sp. NPDC006766]|uniref:hypothetical protein n=1 Tax=Micromonospora sp. NPDC006766 TaxID=3154778 RepID=UPI003405DD77